MARTITWKNVDAPDLSASIEGTLRAGDLIARGLQGFGDRRNERMLQEEQMKTAQLAQSGMELDQQLAALKLQEAQSNFAKYGSTTAPKRTDTRSGSSGGKATLGALSINNSTSQTNPTTENNPLGLSMGEAVTSSSSPTIDVVRSTGTTTNNGNTLSFGQTIPKSENIPNLVFDESTTRIYKGGRKVNEPATYNNETPSSVNPQAGNVANSATPTFYSQSFPNNNNNDYFSAYRNAVNPLRFNYNNMSLDQTDKLGDIYYTLEGIYGRNLDNIGKNIGNEGKLLDNERKLLDNEGKGINNLQAETDLESSLIDLKGKEQEAILRDREFSENEYKRRFINFTRDSLVSVGVQNFTSKEDMVRAIQDEKVDSRALRIALGISEDAPFDISEKDKDILLEMAQAIPEEYWNYTPSFDSVLFAADSDVSNFTQAVASYNAGSQFDAATNSALNMFNKSQQLMQRQGSSNPLDALINFSGQTTVGDDGNEQQRVVEDSPGEIVKIYNALREATQVRNSEGELVYLPDEIIVGAMLNINNIGSADFGPQAFEQINVDYNSALAQLKQISDVQDFSTLAALNAQRESTASRINAMVNSKELLEQQLGYWESRAAEGVPGAIDKFNQALAKYDDLKFEFGLEVDPENTMRAYAVTPGGTGGPNRGFNRPSVRNNFDAAAIAQQNRQKPAPLPMTTGAPLTVNSYDNYVSRVLGNNLLPETYSSTTGTPLTLDGTGENLLPPNRSFGFDLDQQAENFKTKEINALSSKVQNIVNMANKDTLLAKDYIDTVQEAQALAEAFPNDRTIKAYLAELSRIGTRFANN